MNTFFKMAAVALVFVASTKSKQEKGLLDPSSEHVKDIKYERFKKFDLRGTIRQRFGAIAGLQNPEKSSVCSPVASILPLGKLTLGAKSSALKELYRSIGITVESGESDYSDEYHSDYTAVNKHLSELIGELRQVSKPTLDVASRLYVSNDKKLYKRYKEQSKGIFTSAILKLNFSESYSSAEKVNEWVLSQTHRMIPDAITPHDISPESSLIIVTAVYFTGAWMRPFRPPYRSPFYSSKGTKEILMMKGDGSYRYTFSDNLYAQLLEIPYSERNMSLLLVVPRETNGLRDLMKRLRDHPEYLAEAIEEMKGHRVYVTMPTFKIESQWDLKPLYQKVGLKSIFKKQKSGLNGIARKGDLHVTTAIQKTIIEVNHMWKPPSKHSNPKYCIYSMNLD